MSEVNSVEDKAPEETLGAYLTRAREMRGLSREMLSQKTHISITILENIESGDWKKFPIEAYVRGYLNSISESLNLDRAKILSYFSKEYGSSYPKVFVADSKSNLQKSFSSIHERTPSSKNTKWIMIVLVVLALAFLAIMNFVKRAEVSTPSSGDTIAVALPVEDSSTEFTAEVPDGAENVPAESLITSPDMASNGAVSDSLKKSSAKVSSTTTFIKSSDSHMSSSSAIALAPSTMKGKNRISINGNGKAVSWIGIARHLGDSTMIKDANISTPDTRLDYASDDTLCVIVGNPDGVGKMLINGKDIEVPVRKGYATRFCIVDGEMIIGGKR